MSQPMTYVEEQKKLIEHMLSEVENDMQLKGQENFFIESLRDQFDRRGSLSEKQVTALSKFYERVA